MHLVGDVLHDVLEVAVQNFADLAEHIGLDILSFGEFCHRSGGDPGKGDQILLIHVFVNQELPQFIVTDHHQIPPLPFLPVQLVAAWGKFDHYVAVYDFLRFLVEVVYVVDGNEYLVSGIPVDLNDLFYGVLADVFKEEGVVYQMGELGQVQASDVKHYEPFIIRARAMVIEGREGIRLCRLEMNGRAVFVFTENQAVQPCHLAV